MTGPSEERVTQADQEAAASYAETVGWCVDLDWLRTTELPVPLVQAFARHRHAATAPLLDLIEGARDDLERADMATMSKFATAAGLWRFKDQRIASALAALTAALAQHRTNGDG